MVKRNDLPEEARAGNREQCYACYRAKKYCLCGSVKPFATKMRFVILMHTKEARKQRTGTARLAKLCLENAELLIGTDFTRDERVNALLKDPAYSPFVLYPGPGAATFQTLGKEPFPEGKTPLVFVVDGTWECARRLLYRSKNVRPLPRLSFSRRYSSRFIIKKQPGEHCVSTIEAICYLCEEAEAAGYEELDGQSGNLLVLLNKLVETQSAYKWGSLKEGRKGKKKT